MSHFAEKRASLSLRELSLVILFLLLVVGAWTLDSFLNPEIKSTDLNIMAAIVAKDMDASLFSRDHLFSSDTLFRLYTPLYRWIIGRAWRLGGDFETGLVLLVPPLLGLYLAGMFILFWQVTRHTIVALGLTIASAHYHALTVGAEVWGIGGSAEMMSRTFFMPLIPFIALLFLKTCEKPGWRKGLVVGLILGLGANLHPVSAFHLLALLFMSFVLIHGVKGWPTLGAMLGAAILGALPVSLNYLRNSGQPVDPQISFEAFSQVVSQRYAMPFFPGTFEWPLFNLQLTRPALDILVWLYLLLALFFLWAYLWGWRRWPGLVRWSWLVGGSITVAYAYMIVLFQATLLCLIVELYLIYRFRRTTSGQAFPSLKGGPGGGLDGWLIIFMGLVILYAFVGYYLLTLSWQIFELWSLTSLLIEYARAARFVYLPLYLLAGLAIVTWLEPLKEYSLWNRYMRSGWTAAGAVLVFLLILFGPLAPFFASYLPLPARNLLVSQNWARQPYANEVDTGLYSWIQQNTTREALFYGCFGPETMTYFRRKTQRSITHNWKDLTFAIHHRATAIQAFDRFREFEAACKGFDTLLLTARASGADYLLVGHQEAQAYLQEACFVNQRYVVFALDPDGCALSNKNIDD